MSGYVLNDELAVELLDGRVPADVQAEVDLARERIELARHVPDGLAPWLVEIRAAARKNGRLTYSRRDMNRCPLCDATAGYAKFKSSPRRGQPNYNRRIPLRGVDLDRGFFTVSGYVRVGACDDCMEQHSDLLRAFLADERVELPVQLSTSGRPRYRRHQNRRCTKCGWSGHEGEMRRLRTLLGDGSYPGGCPNCDAANVFLGGDVIEVLDGFTIVEDGCWPEAVVS